MEPNSTTMFCGQPTNMHKPKVIITIVVVIKHKLWLDVGCEAKVAAESAPIPKLFQSLYACRKFFSAQRPAEHLYQIFYCKDGHRKRDLIACASHYIQDERNIARVKESKTHVIFLIQIPQGIKGFRGFPGKSFAISRMFSSTRILACMVRELDKLKKKKKKNLGALNIFLRARFVFF